MPLPATYLKATLHFACPDTGSKANCVLWYLAGSGATPPTLATISAMATSFKTAYVTAVTGALAENAQFTGVTLKYVSAGNEVEGDSTGIVIQGTISGDTLPEEVVFCIQRRTGQVGRNKRGRIFFPYLSESMNMDGELTTPGVVAGAALATMVKSPVLHAGGAWMPHTPNWKDGALLPVVQAGIVTSFCSRRDRRSPKVLSAIRV